MERKGNAEFNATPVINGDKPVINGDKPVINGGMSAALPSRSVHQHRSSSGHVATVVAFLQHCPTQDSRRRLRDRHFLKLSAPRFICYAATARRDRSQFPMAMLKIPPLCLLPAFRFRAVPHRHTCWPRHHVLSHHFVRSEIHQFLQRHHQKHLQQYPQQQRKLKSLKNLKQTISTAFLLHRTISLFLPTFHHWKKSREPESTLSFSSQLARETMSLDFSPIFSLA